MKKIVLSILCVVIVFAVGCSSGGSASPTANQATVIPSAPTGLTATPGNAQVALSWTAVSGATSYNVYYGTASSITTGSGTKVAVPTGTASTVSSLTNDTAYYFVVTAVNTAGESAVSNVASATPRFGLVIALTSTAAASGTLPAGSNSVTFDFPAGSVSQDATATITPVTQSNLPVQLSRKTKANGKYAPLVHANDTFLVAFEIDMNPTSITRFNVPVGVSGTVTSVTAGSTVILAKLRGNTWVDVATFIVGATGGRFTQNLPSVSLPGLLEAGDYLLYLPAAGSNTSISNLGIVLLADDGDGMGDDSYGLQVIRLYDAGGRLLTTPTIAYLDYANAYDLDGQALTPDGSQGIMVDGGNTVRFFKAVQTGVPIASTNTVDISAYGGDGDSIAILPNGDEAVVSGDSYNQLVVINGILSGSPAAATTITTPSYRDGLVISNDGKVLLARGYSGVTVYSIELLTTPVAGSVAGTVSHTYTQQADLTTLGTYNTEDGRDGMAISPTDSSRAVVIMDSGTIQLLTGLPTTTVVGSAVTMPSGFSPYSVSISPDGKLAIVGGQNGLLMFSGVDTGTLTQVGTSAFVPNYTLGTSTPTLGWINTLGITLDGKYVVAGDSTNSALVVIPFTASGFSAPASVLGGVTIPYNDQLLIH